MDEGKTSQELMRGLVEAWLSLCAAQNAVEDAFAAIRDHGFGDELFGGKDWIGKTVMRAAKKANGRNG